MTEVKELNLNTDWKKVLELIRDNNFSNNYENYYIYGKEYGYLIQKKENTDIYFFLFESKKRIKIYFDDKNFETIDIYTSLEIDNFIKSKKNEIKDVYFKGINGIKYSDNIDHLGICLIQSKGLEVREKEPLDKLKLKKVLDLYIDHSPYEYSIYFYDYFQNEDKNKQYKSIKFEQNMIRKKIILNLVNLRDKKELKTFKFTGPSSIGKSFTLFKCCHSCFNMAYINLKTLYNYKDDLHTSYSIILTELQRFDIRTKLDEINSLIQNNYNNNNSYLQLLLNIMKFLDDGAELVYFVFVFDQFKLKYVKEDFIEKIKTFAKIKIVLCSSINDKNMREECCKTWFAKGKNLVDLNEDNQDYYFYFKKIYNYKKINKNLYNARFKMLGYMPKYINKYKGYNNEEDILDDVKDKIETKIKEFCSSCHLSKDVLISNLRYIINKEFEYKKFNEIIEYCPLKYFIVDFKAHSFKIKPIFPFMKAIINYKIKENECEEYFKQEKYKNDLITNNYVKGDYFEASAKFELVKLKFPENENTKTIILNEIVSMDKIIDKGNKYYMDEDDDDDEDNSEEEDKNEDCDKTNIKDIIINQINDKNEPNNVEEKNNDEEYEEYDIEEEEEDDEKKKFINKLEKGKKVTEKIFKNKELKGLLDKFNTKTELEEFNDEGLSYTAILFAKSIEDYRNDEIKEQSKKSETIIKSDFKGNESLFLDQFSKWGKALDFAYLYGEKDNKIFMGFQMKCYFENSNLSDNAINKIYIKESCRKILVNSMKLFNCKITKWYYYLIFYLNRKSKNENISKSNLNRCDLNKISYFFYDPKNKQFYTKGKKLIVMKQIKTSNEANLDINVVDISEFAFEFPKKRLITDMEKHREMKESFRKDLIKTFKMDENSNVIEVLEKIKNSIGLKKECQLFFHAQFELNKGLICPKKEDYIYLYKKESKNGENNDFIAGLIENDIISYIELSTSKKIEHFNKIIDDDSKYYYVLWKYIQKPTKKRRKGEKINIYP